MNPDDIKNSWLDVLAKGFKDHNAPYIEGQLDWNESRNLWRDIAKKWGDRTVVNPNTFETEYLDQWNNDKEEDDNMDWDSYNDGDDYLDDEEGRWEEEEDEESDGWDESDVNEPTGWDTGRPSPPQTGGWDIGRIDPPRRSDPPPRPRVPQPRPQPPKSVVFVDDDADDDYLKRLGVK